MTSRRGSHRRRRGGKRNRAHVSESIAGYTRLIGLSMAAPGSDATGLTTVTFPDVATPAEHTENRKILRVAGSCFFAAALSAGNYCAAQFCLWAHPKQESWPAVSAYDPFNEGPGESAFEGMLAPRAFARRTFILSVPSAGSTQTISEQHMLRSRAERLLRPGWVLSAGLYVRGTSGVQATWNGLLRAVVAG